MVKYLALAIVALLAACAESPQLQKPTAESHCDITMQDALQAAKARHWRPVVLTPQQMHSALADLKSQGYEVAEEEGFFAWPDPDIAVLMIGSGGCLRDVVQPYDKADIEKIVGAEG